MWVSPGLYRRQVPYLFLFLLLDLLPLVAPVLHLVLGEVFRGGIRFSWEMLPTYFHYFPTHAPKYMKIARK